MEYVDGESLTQVIQRIGTAGKLDWRNAFRVAVHIGRALEKAFEHQDGRWDSAVAQGQGFVPEGDAEAVGLGRQVPGAWQGTMAVGIGLENGQRATAMLAARQAIVARERGQVDDGAGRAAHADTGNACRARGAAGA